MRKMEKIMFGLRILWLDFANLKRKWEFIWMRRIERIKIYLISNGKIVSSDSSRKLVMSRIKMKFWLLI